jgi:hypothetical protein
MTGPQAGVVPDIKWRHYDRIEPGVYTAYCRLARTYRDPGYRRWTCLLVFRCVCGRPHGGRRSRSLVAEPWFG